MEEVRTIAIRGHKDLPRQNQHYVPQCLLQAFAISSSKQIHVFDKATSRRFISAISKVASEKGFNDFVEDGKEKSLEDGLAKMEGEIAPLLRRIIAEESIGWLSRDDRVRLSLFAAAQQTRVKSVREQMRALHENVRTWLTASGHDPKSVEGFEELDFEQQQAKEATMVLLAKDFGRYYFAKQWMLLKTPPDRSLYISDSPVVLHNTIRRPGRGNLGLNVEGIEIYLPISPTLSLSFFCERTAQRFRNAFPAARILRRIGALRDDDGSSEAVQRAFETGKPLKLVPANVEFQNSLQVITSSRFVFSRDGNFELVIEMLRDHPTLAMPEAHRPPRDV